MYHDTGFLETYTGHEIKGCEIFLKDAEQYAITNVEKEIIKGLIMATRVPQVPETLLERIICDADLDYIGRNDFVEVGKRLKQELIQYGFVADDNEWKKLQIAFLTNHQYHTNSSRRLREPQKKLNYHSLLELNNGYNID